MSVPAGSVLTNADIFDADTASAYFTPDVAGTYVLELMVDDGEAFDPDETEVTMEEGTAIPGDHAQAT